LDPFGRRGVRGTVTLRVDPPFTWASGRKAPIYCDNRQLLAYPGHRRTVAESFAALIEKEKWRPEVIAGTATAGIPHAAWLADLMGLPMAYVRGSAKQHGKENRVEGAPVAGKTAVLIEDLISTGGSSIAAATGLVDAGARLLSVAAIFTYGLDVAAERFVEANMRFATLTSFDVLRQVAVELGHLNPDDLAVLGEWREDPAAWSDARS
jgi:orotate phosphoribosyltransferase